MILTPRWNALKYHAVQARLFHELKRFKIAHAGRRSGKTELAKRNLIKKAVACSFPTGRFAFTAPTHRQAVDIYWDDAKLMVPRWAMLGGSPSIAVSESLKEIRLASGTKIQILGMDKPERIEGPPLDGVVLDEYGNMKRDTFALHVRPALSTMGRPGWAWFIGAPEGRNHYWELVDKVIHEALADWGVYTWTTADINPEEAEVARGDMDVRTYQQEYEGIFVSFKGLAYYSFDRQLNLPPDGQVLTYDPRLPLIVCHDFNRVPGNAVICQEQDSPQWLTVRNNGWSGKVTCVLDEVFIESDSTTQKVGTIVGERWQHHKGRVHLYGDAAGGAKTSQGVEGSDWDILDEVYGRFFEKRVAAYYPKSNPPVRVRLNCVNSHLRSASGRICTIIDPRCKKLMRDFDGVTCDDVGNIEKNDALLTHISDGFGYYVAEEHNVGHGFSNKDL